MSAGHTPFPWKFGRTPEGFPVTGESDRPEGGEWEITLKGPHMAANCRLLEGVEQMVGALRHADTTISRDGSIHGANVELHMAMCKAALRAAGLLEPEPVAWRRLDADESIVETVKRRMKEVKEILRAEQLAAIATLIHDGMLDPVTMEETDKYRAIEKQFLVQPELKPCPFKEDHDAYHVPRLQCTDKGSRFIECRDCCCRGPLCNTESGAIEAWNRRAGGAR